LEREENGVPENEKAENILPNTLVSFPSHATFTKEKKKQEIKTNKTR
jgi:hypothetical protein